MDLADFLAEKKGRTSLREFAKEIGVSKTAIDNIMHRRIKKMPKVETLEAIAAAFGISLPIVVEMAGATLGDNGHAARVARELEKRPWMVERLDKLFELSEEEFNAWMDTIVYAQRHRQGNHSHAEDPIR